MPRGITAANSVSLVIIYSLMIGKTNKLSGIIASKQSGKVQVGGKWWELPGADEISRMWSFCATLDVMWPSVNRPVEAQAKHVEDMKVFSGPR